MNFDGSTKIVLADVEMRGIMFIKIHGDHDSKKAADLRHGNKNGGG
jgi:hypothetical protein